MQHTSSAPAGSGNAHTKERAQALAKDVEQEAQQALGTPIRAYMKFSHDWTMPMAVMVAYNLITSFIPLVLAVVTIASLIPAGSGNTAKVANQINTILPAEVRSNIDVQSILTRTQHISGILGLITIVALLWGGSNLFGAIECAFAVIFRVNTRRFVRQKLMSFSMILLFVLLVPLSFISTIVLSSATTTLGKIMPSAVSGPAVQALALAASIGSLFLLFLSIYVVVPNLPVTWKNAWRGALIAAVLIWLVNLIFPLYTAHFVNSKQYGAAAIGTALIAIAWFWLFSVVLLAGAQVNALAMNIGPWPYDLSRMLMWAKLPAEGGQPTGVDAVRAEASTAHKHSPFGIALDAPKMGDPAAGSDRPAKSPGS
jgi:membrane protein